MILTVKNYTEFHKMHQDGVELDDNTTLSMLSGLDPRDIKVDKEDQIRNELLQQIVASEPVYLFKWKGKTYGYHPAELETIGDVLEASELSKQGKFNLLCSLLFREVKTTSKWLHWRNWNKFHGVKVKFISKFKQNYWTYDCKKLPSLGKIDTSIWNDFPFEILSSNLNFLLGNGLSLSLNIQTYSPKATQKLQKVIQQFQTDTVSMAYSWIWQKESSTQGNLDTKTSSQSTQGSSLMYSHGKNTTSNVAKIKKTLESLTGEDKTKEIEGMFAIRNDLFYGRQISDRTLKTLTLINSAVRHSNRASYG